jgi:hypothetical protein
VNLRAGLDTMYAPAYRVNNANRNLRVI